MTANGLGRARLAAALALLLAGGQASAGGAAVADPTRPPEGRGKAASASDASGGEPPLVLQSLLVGDGRRLAIISGRPVRVGERIQGLTVQNILQREVVLSDGGETRILRMGSTDELEKVPSN
jgi:MSHA biogenesis protein MshK